MDNSHSNIGVYSVVVHNSVGSAASNGAALTASFEANPPAPHRGAHEFIPGLDFPAMFSYPYQKLIPCHHEKRNRKDEEWK